VADNYSRFSRVVQDYIRYRPRYPLALVDRLEAECGFSPTHIVADIGSGTGLLSEIFLKNGNQVIGVEPNPEMRAAAEVYLAQYPLFKSINATAEAIHLPDHSVHLITAGQAFHWFDHVPTRKEFTRILVPGGWVVLVWNLFTNPGTPFVDAFERFWQKYINPREHFNQRTRPEDIDRFFGAEGPVEIGVANPQVCDFEMLKGRVLSSSMSPPADNPLFPVMLDELRAIFDQHQEAGTVTLEYDTRMVYGKLSTVPDV